MISGEKTYRWLFINLLALFQVLKAGPLGPAHRRGCSPTNPGQSAFMAESCLAVPPRGKSPPTCPTPLHLRPRPVQNRPSHWSLAGRLVQSQHLAAEFEPSFSFESGGRGGQSWRGTALVALGTRAAGGGRRAAGLQVGAERKTRVAVVGPPLLRSRRL